MSQRTCKIDGCSNLLVARGWCSKHYKRWRKHGTPNYVASTKSPMPCSVFGCTSKQEKRQWCEKHYRQHLIASNPPCSIDGCNRNAEKRGWCNKHYRRWQKSGHPETGNRRFSDPEKSFAYRTRRQGHCLIWTGSKNQNGYGTIRINGVPIPAHRYAWERVNGPIPEGMMVDHKNCYNPACCNVEHLRLATDQQNKFNRPSAQNNSSTGTRNVYPCGNVWRVQLMKDRKAYHFGTYQTIEEASVVAERARQELFGDFAGRG